MATLNHAVGIDLVTPVPIHPKRLKQRGYNQVEKFAKEVALQIGVKFQDGILTKMKHTKTQVFQSKLQRWKSVQHSFALVNSEAIRGKRVLLVDDIITTVATINACVGTLQKGQPKSIAVASIAIAAGGFR